MPRHLGACLLVLALAACGPLLAAPSGPLADVEGVKASAEHDSDTPDAPATTVWGMLVTIVLVMGASTATLLGGGIRNAVLFQRSGTPTVSGPAASAAPTTEAERAPRAQRSQKQKVERSFARGGRSTRSSLSVHVARRGLNQAKPRRRGGPGCRGVR